MLSSLLNSHMPITHIAFDLDGVLFTSEDFIGEAYSSAIKASGLSATPPTTEMITAQFGNPGTIIMQALFGKLSENDRVMFRTHLVAILEKNINDGKGRLYDGIIDALKALSHKNTLAVCSNGSEKYVKAILENKNIKQYFLPLQTLNSTGKTNKTDLLKGYIESTNTSSENWVMMGDRKTDLDAARNNGCNFIGCAWGFPAAGELDGADIIINHPNEMVNAINKLEKPLS